ncbi:hypothetical protein B0T44_16035 [Nocardia donostiensis]|uniref:Uncharacterized protein n=1 Tax=Nocardia donostiensis TaxID=1538463 RepID=A0A1W0ASN9_9NOCA|nr:hypothetical protein B0T46_20735 [Nocardia donostiensis]OQS13251.1 hypothetical protein B0T36_20780 [Nocardia donostiensis]OQS19161.1 hypothetical protein B0T44_16035 [Nocardia donostiensis]
MGTNNQTGRHRLGMAGRVHCLEIPAVAAALAEHRRTWFTSLISPARHSFAAMRRRPAVLRTRWVPATAG